MCILMANMEQVGVASGNGQNSTTSPGISPSSRKRSFSRRHIENEDCSSAVLHVPFSKTALGSPRQNWRVSRTGKSTNQATEATRKAASLLQICFLIVLKFPFPEATPSISRFTLYAHPGRCSLLFVRLTD
jgi:hypothetical protein